MTSKTTTPPTTDVWDTLLSEEVGPNKVETLFTRSTLLERATYSKIMQSLTLTFRNGAKYCYFNIPKEVADDLFSYSSDKNTGSAGKFFVKEIKFKYTHHKL